MEVHPSSLLFAEVRMHRSHYGTEKRVKLWLESLVVTHLSLIVLAGVQLTPNFLCQQVMITP